MLILDFLAVISRSRSSMEYLLSHSWFQAFDGMTPIGAVIESVTRPEAVVQ